MVFGAVFLIQTRRTPAFPTKRIAVGQDAAHQMHPVPAPAQFNRCWTQCEGVGSVPIGP